MPPPEEYEKVRFDAAGVLNFVNHFVSKEVNTSSDFTS